MNLYRVHVWHGSGCSGGVLGTFYVIARTETEASKHVLAKCEEWDYWKDSYVKQIDLVAQEGQYGKPMPLLFACNQINDTQFNTSVFIDGQFNDPKNCPKSNDGKCPQCQIDLQSGYGFSGGYGLGTYQWCIKCYEIYDFMPEPEQGE